jgi:UPF0755 protein
MELKNKPDSFFADETRKMDVVAKEHVQLPPPEQSALEQSGLEPPKSHAEKIESIKKKQAIKKRKKRRQQHVRTFSHIFGSLLLIVFIITVSAFLSQFIVRGFLDFMGITVAEFSVTIEVPADSTTEEIAEILNRFDIIAMPGFFTFYSRINEKDGGYLNGLFTLSSTMSYSQIINTLQNRPRSTETVSVKITEGMTAREIAQLLEENHVCRGEDFMEYYKTSMSVFNFERRLTLNTLKFNQMEGYLFPDTHEFFVVNGLEDNPEMDTSRYAEVAARTIFHHMNAQLTPEIYRRIADLGDSIPGQFGLDEFMTVASMVQWEAAEPEHMRLVASVFLNRLRNPSTFPRLESDVTEKYANENILPYLNTENTVLIESMIAAYNTYDSDGLPPGPVNNPGMDAILAVLNAPSNNLFYFCADIETGEMFFAEDYQTHLANLEKANIDINEIRR